MFKKTKIITKLLLLVPLLAQGQSLPQLSFGVEYSDQFDTVIDQHYANLLNPNNAFGFEIAFGAKEFRLAGTWSYLLNCQHLFRATAEYLSQNTLFVFDQIPLPLWDEQSAYAASYSFLTNQYGVASYNFGIYGLKARDENLNPRTYDTPFYTIYRDVKGSVAYGGFAGVTLQPWRYTRLTGTVYYDDISFRNIYESSPDRQGVGAGFELQQILHPRLLLSAEASDRKLYQQYGIKASWLIPIPRCSKIELAIKGEKVEGRELAVSPENRIGMMISYRWDLPDCASTYLTPKTFQEDVLIAATNPVVRMAQVLAAREEHKQYYP